MIIPLLAVALLASQPVAPPKLDPVKDQPMVCKAAFLDKLQSVRDGGPAVSLIVPLYTDAAKMNDKDAEAFARGCDLYEQGVFAGLKAAPQSAAPAPESDDDEGELAPDHRDEPVAFRR